MAKKQNSKETWTKLNIKKERKREREGREMKSGKK